MTTRRELLILLAIGFLLREIFAPWTGHPWDLEVFARAGYYVANGSNPYTFLQPIEGITFAPYANMTSVGYPPLWPLMCGFLYHVYEGIAWITSISSPYLYYFLLKQPAILGDLLSAVVASRLVGEKCSKSVIIFWLFNPLMIILSAIWGMFDSLAVLLCLLAIKFIIDGKSRASATSLGIGTALKLIPVIYMPIVMLFSKSKLKFALLFSVSISVIILAPFLLLGWSPLGFLFSMASQAVNIRDAPAIGGLTIFSFLEPVSIVFHDGITFMLLTVLSFLWIPALGIFYLKLYWPLLKGIARNSAGEASKGSPWEFSMSEILRLLIIANLIFLLTRPWISEGTALYLISLMLIDVVLFHNDRKGLLTAIWVFALLFLIANNTLLVRFISPITSAAVPLDLDINNGPITGPIRTAIRLLLSFAFYFTVIKSLQIYWKSPKQVRPVAARLVPTNDFGPGPKVITVGICAHNEQGNIGKLLDNLKGQKLGKEIRLLEILVVSSGSTDSTDSIVSEKAKTFSKISLITEPKRTGKSSAENIILSRAKGNVIVLISADSILKPGALNRLVGAFEGNVGGAIARAVPLNDNTGLVNFASRFIWELLNQTNLHLNSYGRLNSLGSDMLAIRSGIVVSIPDNVVNDDAYLGTVVRKKGFQISYVPDSVLYIRGPSTTSDFFKQRRRIIYGHKQINSLFKVKPNILENILLSDPFSAAMIFIKTCSRFSFYDLPKVPFVLALELVSQIKFRTDKKENYILWDMVATSKQEIPDGEMELSP